MNPLLEKSKTSLMASAQKLFETREEQQGDDAAELMGALEDAVLAGNKIMFDPKTHAHLEIVKNPASRKDPVSTVSKGITGLCWIMYMQSKQEIDPQVLIMAGFILINDALDFVERGYGIKVDEQVLAETTKRFSEQIMEKLGITEEHLREYQANGKVTDFGQPQQQNTDGILSQPRSA